MTEFLRFARPPRLSLEVVEMLAPRGPHYLHRPRVRPQHVSPSLATQGGPETVVADGFQLKHAVLNLVLNALQATPAEGKVVIGVRGDAEGLAIDVRDTGEGMAEDVLPRALEAFFTTREGGTGLGLPITRRIVEAHGGTLAIRSREGEGTVATVSLPAGLRAG